MEGWNCWHPGVKWKSRALDRNVLKNLEETFINRGIIMIVFDDDADDDEVFFTAL